MLPFLFVSLARFVAIGLPQTWETLYCFERVAAGEEWHEHDFVFGSTIGTGLYESTLRRQHQQLIAQAKLPRLTVHELRHTYTSLALLRDLDIKEVSKRLGHSTVGITLDIYQHLYPGQDEAAALSSDQLLGDPPLKHERQTWQKMLSQIPLPSICHQEIKRRETLAD